MYVISTLKEPNTMNKHRQKITTNLMTLRRLTRPAIHSLTNSIVVACLRLLVQVLTDVDAALEDLDERTPKP